MPGYLCLEQSILAAAPLSNLSCFVVVVGDDGRWANAVAVTRNRCRPSGRRPPSHDQDALRPYMTCNDLEIILLAIVQRRVANVACLSVFVCLIPTLLSAEQARNNIRVEKPRRGKHSAKISPT